jgi:hypothetical protein
VYVRNVNGTVLDFATPWFMHRANKMMYDRQTKTMWQQFLGEPIVGPFADTDFKLSTLPVTVTTWGEWFTLHPETTVLDIDTGVYPAWMYRAEDDPDSAYHGYRGSPRVMFPVWNRSDRLSQKTQVIGIQIQSAAKAYPLETIREQGLLNDVFGDENLVLVSTGGGLGARAYRTGEILFQNKVTDGPILSLEDHEGNLWSVQEDHLVVDGSNSTLLPRIRTSLAYWFAWYLFHPSTEVYLD